MFARLRKGEKSECSQSRPEYADKRGQQDNQSQYSRGSMSRGEEQNTNYRVRSQRPNNDYDYGKPSNDYGYQKPANDYGYRRPEQNANNNRKYENNLDNLPKPGSNSHHPSVSSSSSAADQYICNNCINEALIYEKQLNAKNNDRPYLAGEDPMHFQDRMNALAKDQRENRLKELMNRAEQAGKNINEPSDKDKLINENEKGTFFLDKDNEDPMKKKVMDKYNQNDLRNRQMGGKYGNKPGVDDYYKNYVDNYKNNNEEPYDDDKRNQQQLYNQALKDQIEQNRKLRNRGDPDRKYMDERQRENDKYEKELEEEARKLREKQNELLMANKNLMDAKRKKELNDKMLDEYDQRRNAANLKKQMDDEDEKRRQEEDAKRKGWQKALDNQINERNQRNKLEKDLNNIPENAGEEHYGCENGKCCVCKRTYPLALLNPRKKYASLARIQKLRKQREQQKRGERGERVEREKEYA